MIGTATAAASNVEVSSHSVLVVELPMSLATSGSTGISTEKVKRHHQAPRRDHRQRDDLAGQPADRIRRLRPRWAGPAFLPGDPADGSSATMAASRLAAARRVI